MIDLCPYERLLSTRMTLEADNVLVDSGNKLLFKITQTEIVSCGDHCYKPVELRVYHTAEGFYLSDETFWNVLNIVNGTRMLTANEFLLADKDYENRKLLKLFQKVASQICLLFLTTIRTLSRLEDEFVKIADTNGNNMVVYANSGVVYIPTCVEINEITVKVKLSNCYEDTPVFTIYNTNISAFLTTGMIIRPTPRIIA